ncbi:MAG: disulfide bond formation protein B [Methylocystaceae bacterium]|nr:MAG: disulfide bond formation protein B [Methylocystaceae bacterium]
MNGLRGPARRASAPLCAALVILVVGVSTIAGAWIYESLGYLPCELCLKQRIPYYIGIPLAALAAVAVHRGRESLARAGLVALALLFAAGAALAVYHSGVELKLFSGPSDCAGALNTAGSVDAFLKQLQTTKVVRCDEPALWVLGLTLSNWNAMISAFLAALAVAAILSLHEGCRVETESSKDELS